MFMLLFVATLSYKVLPPSIITDDNKGWYVAEIPQADVRNIRLTESSDKDIPFFLIPPHTSSSTVETLVTDATNTDIISNDIIQKQRVLVVDTLKEGQMYFNIHILTEASSTDARHKVRVFISDSLLKATSPAWKEIEQRNEDYLHIAVPGISSRYIKLSFENVDAAGSEIARIQGVVVSTDNITSEHNLSIKEYLQKNTSTSTYIIFNTKDPGLLDVKISVDDGQAITTSSAISQKTLVSAYEVVPAHVVLVAEDVSSPSFLKKYTTAIGSVLGVLCLLLVYIGYRRTR